VFRSSRCSGPTTAAVASSSGESSKRLRRISRTLSPTSPASDMRAGGEEEKSSGCGGSRLIAARERPGSTRPRAAAGASSRLRASSGRSSSADGLRGPTSYRMGTPRFHRSCSTATVARSATFGKLGPPPARRRTFRVESFTIFDAPSLATQCGRAFRSRS